jgi:putative transposase
LQIFDTKRYSLVAWVVMPNHVHVLFQPVNGWSVAKIVASWKKFTAREICDYLRNPGNANLPIGPSGIVANLPIGVTADDATRRPTISAPIWHREYWDRYIRDERHFLQAIDYIHQNPVKAGLVARAEDWPWSSARLMIDLDRKTANPEIHVSKSANREIGVPEIDSGQEPSSADW